MADTFHGNHRIRTKRSPTDSGWAFDLSDDVVSIDTARQYGAPEGNFVVTVVPGAQGQKLSYTIEGQPRPPAVLHWDDLIQPSDTILIELDDGAGYGLRPIMLGSVTSVNRVMRVLPSGQPEESVVLAGQDLGKLLVRHQVGWDIVPLDSHYGSEQAVLQSIAQQAYHGTPGELVDKLMDAFFYRILEQWAPFIQTNITTDDDWTKFDVSLLTRSGSMWSVLQSVSNPPWNTLHGDTRDDGVFHLTLEKTPFHEKTGRVVRPDANIVENDDLTSYNLGRSDTERTNYLYLHANLISFGDNSEFPIYFLRKGMAKADEDSVKEHGLHPVYPSTSFAPYNYEPDTNADEKPSVADEAVRRADILWNWNQLNPTRKSGPLTIKGTTGLRAGSMVRVPSLDLDFLAEKVTHKYVWGSHFRTIVHVSRGMRSAQ